MNKLFTKIGTAMVGIAMAIGVGVAVGRDGFKKADASVEHVDFNVTYLGLADDTSYAAVDTTKQDDDIGVTFKYSKIHGSGGKMNLQSGAGEIYNSTAMPGKITKIDIKTTAFSGSSGGGYYLYGGTSSKDTTDALYHNTRDIETKSVDFGDNNYTYFYLKANTNRMITIEYMNVYYEVVEGNIKPLTITAKHGDDTIAKDSTYSYTDALQGKVTFTVSATYDSGEGYVAGSGFDWSSSDTDVATVANGVVTVKTRGTTTISVATNDATNDEDNKSTSFTLDTTGALDAKGTEENPFTPSEAKTFISALPNQSETSESYYVVGYVTSKQAKASYDNYNYWIGDTSGTSEANSLQVYRGLSSADYEILAVADKVVVYGKFQNYNGNTPEVKSSTFVNDYVAIENWTKNDAGLDMDGYDSTGSKGSTGGDGSCTTRYWVAKADLKDIADVFSDAITLFQENDDFADAKERYEEWAGFNGDSSTKYDMSKLTPSSVVIAGYVASNNSGITAIIVIAAVLTSITVGGVFLLRKKEEK